MAAVVARRPGPATRTEVRRRRYVSIYDAYAAVYDQSGQLAFSLKMLPYLNAILVRHPVSGNGLLELACGTGTVAIAMAGAGWHVYGVDGSAQMLAQARIKAAGEGVTVNWSQQDIRRIVLPERVHLATCLYDSMNYMLTSHDLEAVFGQVYDALLPAGLFLFDMNTAYVLSTVWDDETYWVDEEAFTVILHNDYDPLHQRAHATLTLFQRTGDNQYAKIVEKHTEQAYPEEHVTTLLCDAGFVVEARYHCFGFTAPNDTTPRIMWVARRPE